MSEYKYVKDVIGYLASSEAKFADIEAYEKYVTVKFRIAEKDEEIVTKLENGLEETKNIARKGDYIVTNPTGEGDKYVVSPEEFKKRYKIIGPGEAKSIGIPQFFVRIAENVKIEAPWGEIQFLEAGAVLNVSDLNKIYGINRSEFEKTYKKL